MAATTSQINIKLETMHIHPNCLQVRGGYNGGTEATCVWGQSDLGYMVKSYYCEQTSG